MSDLEIDLKKWGILLLLAALVLLAFLAVGFFSPNAATLLKRGRLEFERGSYSSARDKFEKAFHLSKKRIV